MNPHASAFFAGIGALGVVFLLFIFNTLVGAIVGWFVGFAFGPTILSTLSRFHVSTAGLQMWELGATLGFVGSFFRSHLNLPKKGR